MSKSKKDFIAFAINLEIYPQTVAFFFGDPGNKEAMTAFVAKHFGVEEFNELEDPEGLAGQTYKYARGVLIWMPHSPRGVETIGTLVHEITHATFFIARNIGLDYSRRSEEFFSYMNDYLMVQCLTHLLEDGKKK